MQQNPGIRACLVITVEKENNIMIYDLNRDGRIGLQDAVYAVRQGNLKAARPDITVCSRKMNFRLPDQRYSEGCCCISVTPNL